MIKKMVHRLFLTGFVAFFSSLSLMAQHKVEMVPFGDMDQWVDRQIKESGIIGGNTKNVYEIGPTTVIKGDQVYKNMGGSPWATSNVMAKVAGITKTNTFSGETGRRLLCTPGYAYGECEGTGACQYNRIGCRLYLYGICARTDQGYQEPAEDASDGDSVYQEAGCPSV